MTETKDRQERQTFLAVFTDLIAIIMSGTHHFLRVFEVMIKNELEWRVSLLLGRYGGFILLQVDTVELFYMDKWQMKGKKRLCYTGVGTFLLARLE